MVKLLGVDDAGRGPIIGPMVLAGILIDEEDVSFLKELGAKDSKLLSAFKREQIRKRLDKFRSHVELSFPEEIDRKNVNHIEAEKAARIIKELASSVDEEIVAVIDCPSPNIESWRNMVLAHLEGVKNVRVVCEHKADLNHIVVSAASIIAKEVREEQVRKIKSEFGIDFGSGYVSDSRTVDFIKENHKDPRFKGIIRESWGTLKQIVREEEQKTLF